MATLTQVSHAELEEQLATGAVRFAFKKRSGDLRMALGTRQPTRIPDRDQPTGQRTTAHRSLAYYDLELGQWRAVSRQCEVFI